MKIKTNSLYGKFNALNIKLRYYDPVVNSEEHTQEVRYIYSIDDSSGLLLIDLTIPEQTDPVEFFVYHTKDLYKGFREYVVYYKCYKYRLDIDNCKFCDEVYLSKIKMW